MVINSSFATAGTQALSAISVHRLRTSDIPCCERELFLVRCAASDTWTPHSRRIRRLPSPNAEVDPATWEVTTADNKLSDQLAIYNNPQGLVRSV